MSNFVCKAVTKAISLNFKAEVFTEEIKQGFKRPCFFVRTSEIKEVKLIGRRFFRRYSIEVKYFGKTNADCGKTAEKLYTALNLIESDEGVLRAAKIGGETNKNEVTFCADYKTIGYYGDEEYPMMERLEMERR